MVFDATVPCSSWAAGWSRRARHCAILIYELERDFMCWTHVEEINHAQRCDIPVVDYFLKATGVTGAGQTCLVHTDNRACQLLSEENGIALVRQYAPWGTWKRLTMHRAGASQLGLILIASINGAAQAWPHTVLWHANASRGRRLILAYCGIALCWIILDL